VRSTPGAPLRKGLPGAVISLQRAVGNRAVRSLLQRARGAGTRAKPKAGAPAPAPGPAPTAEELVAAEAWVTYIALRGNRPAPAVAVPPRYKGLIETLKLGVAGNPGEPDHLDIAGSAALLKRLRADHDKVMPKADHSAFDLAQLALERALVNVGKGPDAFEGGATQLEFGQNLGHIWTEADEELREAKAAGYTIPERLATASEEAQAMFHAAAAGWRGGAPDANRLITPSEEVSLVEFRRETVEVINSMRAKRGADEARARRREAEALEAAAEKHLAELRTIMAERRRQLFRAGSTSKLKDLHAATGEIVRAIDDTKAAAAIITSRVDQLNAVAKMVTAKGQNIINLPELPQGMTAVAGKIKAAHGKLTTALELIDLISPGKTELDQGLKYLQGVDIALEHFASKTANPFIAVYVNSYLGPGIKNCIAQLGNIAAQMSAQNRSLIGAGLPRYVNWALEPGGEPAYAYLVLLFRQGAGAPLSDAAYSYFDDHDDDLSAAVGTNMPSSRGALGEWAHSNRYLLWEAFYGATRPPG
jgi:hypothetical protein